MICNIRIIDKNCGRTLLYIPALGNHAHWRLHNSYMTNYEEQPSGDCVWSLLTSKCLHVPQNTLLFLSQVFYNVSKGLKWTSRSCHHHFCLLIFFSLFRSRNSKKKEKKKSIYFPFPLLFIISSSNAELGLKILPICSISDFLFLFF